MMHFFLLGCWSLLIAYAWIIVRRWFAWLKIPEVSKTQEIPSAFVSVIVPVRNEAKNIQALLGDLERQTYPKANYEVLIIDDYSEDGTAEIVSAFNYNSELPLQIIYLQDNPGLRQKKAAISTGINLAKGELILQTDGDCRVGADWIFAIAQFYEQNKAVCISGPVGLLDDGSLFTRMQVVEFASLIGIGGASMALGKPNMCNGANLAYSRQAFLEVHGFTGNEQVASGDDEFLMHKLAEKFPGKVYFLKSPAVIVFTAAQKTLSAFINQRIRWASKWPNYTNWRIKLLAILVFTTNLGLFLAFLSWLCGGLGNSQITYLYVFKFLTDGLFLLTVLHFYNRKQYIIYLIPLQFVYIPYVLYTALLGLRGTYYWKSRLVKN